MNFAKLKFKGEIIPIVYNLSEDGTQGIFSTRVQNMIECACGHRGGSHRPCGCVHSFVCCPFRVGNIKTEIEE